MNLEQYQLSREKESVNEEQSSYNEEEELSDSEDELSDSEDELSDNNEYSLINDSGIITDIRDVFGANDFNKVLKSKSSSYNFKKIKNFDVNKLIDNSSYSEELIKNQEWLHSQLNIKIEKEIFQLSEKKQVCLIQMISTKSMSKRFRYKMLVKFYPFFSIPVLRKYINKIFNALTEFHYFINF